MDRSYDAAGSQTNFRNRKFLPIQLSTAQSQTAGMTDRLSGISDIVKVLEDWAGSKMKAALLICVFCLSRIAARAETDANTLLRSYDAASPTDKQNIAFAVSQLEYGLAWANGYLKATRKEAPLYCAPPNMALTGEQILDILRRDVKKTPSNGIIPYGLAILDALHAVFPCQ